MKINAIDNFLNNKITKSNTNKTYIEIKKDSFSPSFKQSEKKNETSLFNKIKISLDKKRKENYEKSLPQNLSDKKLARKISIHGGRYLESLKTREDREQFVVLMSNDFNGKPMGGTSRTLSAYEANAVITKDIENVQTYIDLVDYDEKFQSLCGLTRPLTRLEAETVMPAGITDFQKYIDLVDLDEDKEPVSGYSRALTTQEAITVMTNNIEDVESFIFEQDKK